MKRKVSLSIGKYQQMFGEREALRIAAEAGVDAVDLDLTDRFDYRKPGNIYAGTDEEIAAYFTDLCGYASSLGIEIGQTHGRIKGFMNKEEEDEALVKNARLDCLATAALGAPVCVIHTTTTICMGADAAPELMHRINYEMFTRILPFAKEFGVKIATETFGDASGLGVCDFFGNIREFLIGYNRIKATEYAPYFTTCIDTGHSNKATRFNNNPKPGDVIRLIGGQNIAVLHLNDNDTLTDQHKIPMTGTIDWKDVFDALDEVGYNGVYNMELNLSCFGRDMAVETGKFAVKVMRSILAARYGADCLTDRK